MGQLVVKFRDRSIEYYGFVGGDRPALPITVTKSGPPQFCVNQTVTQNAARFGAGPRVAEPSAPIEAR